MQIILASQSPRRQQLLKQMGLEFTVQPSAFDEQLDDTRHPHEVAKELALGKAMDVAKKFPDALIIGADTIVTVDGRQLEKPHNNQEAYQTLRHLADKPNEVCTGVAIICASQGIALTDVDATLVYFKPFDETAVQAYLATGDHMDKAGSYGIQSGAATLIDHIEGHYDTVVGLPTRKLAAMLKSLGIEATVVELPSVVPQIL